MEGNLAIFLQNNGFTINPIKTTKNLLLLKVGKDCYQ